MKIRGRSADIPLRSLWAFLSHWVKQSAEMDSNPTRMLSGCVCLLSCSIRSLVMLVVWTFICDDAMMMGWAVPVAGRCFVWTSGKLYESCMKVVWKLHACCTHVAGFHSTSMQLPWISETNFPEINLKVSHVLSSLQFLHWWFEETINCLQYLCLWQYLRNTTAFNTC